MLATGVMGTELGKAVALAALTSTSRLFFFGLLSLFTC